MNSLRRIAGYTLWLLALASTGTSIKVLTKEPAVTTYCREVGRQHIDRQSVPLCARPSPLRSAS